YVETVAMPASSLPAAPTAIATPFAATVAHATSVESSSMISVGSRQLDVPAAASAKTEAACSARIEPEYSLRESSNDCSPGPDFGAISRGTRPARCVAMNARLVLLAMPFLACALRTEYGADGGMPDAAVDVIVDAGPGPSVDPNPGDPIPDGHP